MLPQGCDFDGFIGGLGNTLAIVAAFCAAAWVVWYLHTARFLAPLGTVGEIAEVIAGVCVLVGGLALVGWAQAKLFK